jgi:predicted alpha/beta superfamily hydrolase
MSCPLAQVKLVLVLMLLAVVSAVTIASANIAITIVVQPPADTPADATLYIAGNHQSIGPWVPDRHALKRADDGTWRTTLDLPDQYELEFKITQGSWATVEKSAEGADIANRLAVAKDGLILTIHMAAWGAKQGNGHRPIESSLTGNIKLIRGFRSKVLGNERNLIVYLPEAYDREPNRRFPVLYMHDGQNLFDRATSAFGTEWGADETAQLLIRENKVEPLIIVGIYTEANRIAELTDAFSKKHGDGGKARLFARFLVEELKPFIDRTYRTKPDRANTGVGGSSLGGLMSLFLVESYPDVYSRCAAVSPALLWSDGALIQRWRRDRACLPRTRTKFWVDVGSNEAVQDMPAETYLNSVRSLVEVFKEAGLTEGQDYRFVVKEGAEHNEAAWQERFPAILEFLYPAR